MKNISENKWISLSIDLHQKDDIQFLYKNFHHKILGTFEENGKLIFYFDHLLKNSIYNVCDNKFIINDIKYQNWHRKYEKYFKPIKINDEIIIIPDGHSIDYHSDYHIKIKPGMAFGTGTHETTQLILCKIKKYINKGDSVLDLGSGSGILAIASIKYGASNVTCFEHDHDCRENFFENMKLNNISDNYQLFFDDVLSITSFDYQCILANINRNVILNLLPKIKKFRINKSKIILSGLLISDRDEVMNLINELGFNVIDNITKGEWVCLIIE